MNLLEMLTNGLDLWPYGDLPYATQDVDGEVWFSESLPIATKSVLGTYWSASGLRVCSSPYYQSDGPNADDYVTAVITRHQWARERNRKKRKTQLAMKPSYDFTLKIQAEHITLGVILLDSQHGVLGFKRLFDENILSASFYRREVAKAALNANASAVITTHYLSNSDLEPSGTDKALIKGLKTALEAVHVQLLDHLVIGGGESVSFEERGLL
tara:strand:+ start:556 stop:1194 length:639 start_codon:yes stop_codon:yes gene_type:complete